MINAAGTFVALAKTLIDRCQDSLSEADGSMKSKISYFEFSDTGPNPSSSLLAVNDIPQ